MMHNDSAAILNDLLAQWHHWMTGAPINGVDRLDDPTFRDARSRSGWDSSGDVVDRELTQKTMKAIDFIVGGDSRGQGGLPDTKEQPYRSAIYCVARNACLGVNVWASPRLPESLEERAIVVMEARNMVMRRLMDAGVM